MTESPHHDKPMQGIFMLSTASTAQGFTLDGNLPVAIVYSGVKTASGEYTFAETNDNYPILAVENKEDLIAEGTWSSRHTPWSKLGFNPDITTLEEPINYAGVTNWPSSTGFGMSVVSLNNLDKVGSSGATQIYVKYLGPDYVERSTIVLMNGTTKVALVDTSISRINNFQIYAGNAALGDIFIAPTTNSTATVSSIPTGLTRARNTMYTVPSSKTLYIKNIYYSATHLGSGARPTRILLRSNYNDTIGIYSTSLFWPVSANLLEQDSLYAQLSVPIRIPEKTDLYVSAITISASSGNMVESILRGWLVENT